MHYLLHWMQHMVLTVIKMLHWIWQVAYKMVLKATCTVFCLVIAALTALFFIYVQWNKPPTLIMAHSVWFLSIQHGNFAQTTSLRNTSALLESPRMSDIPAAFDRPVLNSVLYTFLRMFWIWSKNPFKTFELSVSPCIIAVWLFPVLWLCVYKPYVLISQKCSCQWLSVC